MITSSRPRERPLRALTLSCWLLLLGYGAGLVVHAHDEITETFDVDVNGRVHRFPVHTDDGEIIDPRVGDLRTERCQRRGHEATLARYQDRTVLIVGRSHTRPLIFDPQRGVVLLEQSAPTPEPIAGDQEPLRCP
ncbi:MAG: hypothetical protein ACE366_11630 [Bradymonadia bacterium]